MSRRTQRALLAGPVLLLALCYAVLAARAGTPWPWSAVVHEDGRRSLLQTVFYFEHALGELPLDILLAAALGASARLCWRPRASPAQFRVWASAAVAVDALIVAGATWSVGAGKALEYLLQSYTRSGDPPVYGSHWRYHLLSQLALLALVAIPSRPAKRPWLAFAILTVLFLPNADPFLEPRHLGHQARELFTHTLVTIPLAFGVCLTLAKAPPARPDLNRRMLALAMVTGAYLAGGVLFRGSLAHAQTGDPASVVCAHLFEHALGYLVVASHAAVVFLWPRRQE